MGAAKTRQTGAPRSRNARGEGEKLRGEIIDAAVKVLSALGPEDPFSLRSVAKMAKIAAPSVYIHFADRNVLLLAVLEKLFAEQVAIRAAAEADAAKAGGGAWERLLARSVASVRFGLEHPGHYKVLFEGRVVPRLNDPRIAGFGRPLLVRSIELIREIPSQPGASPTIPNACLFCCGPACMASISLRINKPTLDWPPATELAEQITRTIIQPKVRRAEPGTRIVANLTPTR